MGNLLCGLGRPRKRKKKKKQTTERQNASSTNQIPSSQTGSALSVVQSDTEASESDFFIWYRHSGESLPSGDWNHSKRVFDNPSAQKILEDVGEHDITHLTIAENLPPSLNDIAPHLTHLEIFRQEDHSKLESLRELKELKVLHLKDTDFSDGLPSGIGELKSLTELHIVNCRLTELPQNLGSELGPLKLYLQDTIFSDGLPNRIGELQSLTELQIVRCGITELPKNFDKLKKLEVLDLNCNDLSSGLPSVVAELTSLRELHVGNCSLTDLPEEFGELQQLEVLHLEKNNFSKGLPDVFGKLCSLTELYLQGCSLTDLPPSMSELKQLKTLKLGGNDFSCGCPDVIPQLTALTKLSLQQCVLTRFPPRLEELRRLEVLYLGDNYLSSGIPDVIGDLSSLTELNLQNCSLTDLPLRFGELQKLKRLSLGGNQFSNGLPDMIGNFTSLTQLYIQECFLKHLPSSFDNLQQLHRLDLANNKFTEIPSAVYKLKELEWLNRNDNDQLREMDKRILRMKRLKDVLFNGTSLPAVLAGVSSRGVEVIKKYFIDLAQAVVSTIPVAIIGEAFAGKTCIAKSLMSQKREISDRSSPLENATKVFEVGTLKLGTSEVSLIDFGGQDIYHVAYQLALKVTCVPLVVVNMARYKKLIEEVRSEEQATKRLCMEWLCHLYVAQPTLGRPMLALTHIDELSSREEFETLKATLLQRAEDIRLKWLKREKHSSNTEQQSNSSTKKLKFDVDDIFEFTDKGESSDIKTLTKRIKSRCVGEIPQNWSGVENFLKSIKKPYIEVVFVDIKFHDCREILQYLHTTGTILWFDQKKGLNKYVFHRTQAVTDMVALLFPLDKEKMKTECIVSFLEFSHNEQPIGIATYKQFLDNYLYNTTGMIDEALLCNRVETQTEFEFQIAVELLKCFRIIHGPIQLKDDFSPRTVYLVPSFIRESLDKSWETSGRLQLRFDLILNGLPLPEHVHQLMTVEVLNLKKEDEPVEAYSNGAKIQHDENCTTYLVHEWGKQTVTVQISTNTDNLNDSWHRLKKTTVALRRMLYEEWPACLVELKTYCTHCLFLKDPSPGSLPNPAWYTENKTFSGLKLVKCLKSDAKNLTVPKPFLVPCSNLDSKEIAELEGYLTKWQAFDAGTRQEVPYTDI